MSSAVKPPNIGELTNRLSMHVINGTGSASPTSPTTPTPKSALHPHHNNHQPFRNVRLNSRDSENGDDDEDGWEDDPQLETLAKRFSYATNSFIYKTTSLSRRSSTNTNPQTYPNAQAQTQAQCSIDSEKLRRQKKIDIESSSTGSESSVDDDIEDRPAQPPPLPSKSRVSRASDAGSGILSPINKAPMPLPRGTSNESHTSFSLPPRSNSLPHGTKPPAPPPKPKLIGIDGKVKPPVPVKPVRRSASDNQPRTNTNTTASNNTTSNAEEPYLLPIKVAGGGGGPPTRVGSLQQRERGDPRQSSGPSSGTVKLRPKRSPSQARTSSQGHASVSFAGNDADEIIDASRPSSTDGSRTTRTISGEIPLPVLPVRKESINKKKPNAFMRFFNTFKSIFLPSSKNKRKLKSRKSVKEAKTESITVELK